MPKDDSTPTPDEALLQTLAPELLAFFSDLAPTTPPNADPLSMDALDGAMSVRELARQIKRTLESEPTLDDVAVRGEISNFKCHTKGHCYFTLKDADAQIRCKMWRADAARLPFKPADGHRVVAQGRVEFYGPRGEVNFIADEMVFDGRGALYEAYEQLKTELAEEGLFAPERKKALPLFPNRIGLITSATGAVAHDVITVLRRRWPVATITLIPAAVQGFSAASDLVRALSWASALHDYLDVLIVARGGGSAEDLWCFNDEELVRFAAECPLPLISAVGHETDFTLLDFVADLRAPTPSAAAEVVAPDIEGVSAALHDLTRRLVQGVASGVRLERARLDGLVGRAALRRPAERVAQERQRITTLKARAQELVRGRVKIERRELAAREAQMRALDPQRVLERGYALVMDASTGKLLTATSQTSVGQALRVRFADGEISATAGAAQSSGASASLAPVAPVSTPPRATKTPRSPRATRKTPDITPDES